MTSSVPMSVVNAIHSILSPIYSDMLIKRLYYRETIRMNQEMSDIEEHCCYCRTQGHTIKTCCSESTMRIIWNICRNTNDYLVSFHNGDIDHYQLRITLRVYFYRNAIHSMKVLHVFAGFIDCSLDDCPTKDDKMEAIITKLIELFCPPSPVEPLIPLAKIHIHLNLQVGEKEPEDCPVCLDSHVPTHSMTTLQCNHRVCTGCFQSIFMTDKLRHVHLCPLCRCEINVVTVVSHESYYNIANMYLS